MCCAQCINQWCKKLLNEENPLNKSMILYNLNMKLSNKLSSNLKLHLWALLHEKMMKNLFLQRGVKVMTFSVYEALQKALKCA